MQRAARLCMSATMSSSTDPPRPRRQPRRDRRPRHAHLSGNAGIETVAVYSDVDRLAPHVLMADAAVAHRPGARGAELPRDRQDHRRLQGRPAPTRSTRATASCRRTRTSPMPAPPPASPSSARRPSAMRKMGSKTEARKTVTAAGTPVVPGDNGPDGNGFPTRRAALAAAKKIGFPVLIKAAAGGGGKGMRLVASEAELPGRVRRRAAARRPPRSATAPSTSRRRSSGRATSRSRCSATRTATSSTSASATARSSAATRR